MITMPSFNPTVRFIIALLLGGLIFGTAIWFYKDAVTRADQAEVTVQVVTEGELSAAKSREKRDEALNETRKIKAEVEYGERKIISSDGKYLTKSFSDRLRSKNQQDRTLFNRTNP